jgi:hypothetical protein
MTVSQLQSAEWWGDCKWCARKLLLPIWNNIRNFVCFITGKMGTLESRRWRPARCGNGRDNSQKTSMLRVSTHGTSVSMLVDMSRNKCFLQVWISHVFLFIYICHLFTGCPSYSEAAGFESWSQHRLYWLRYFAVFLNNSRQISR